MRRKRFSPRDLVRLGRKGAVLVFVALLLLVSAAGTQAAPPAQSPEEGHAIFEQKCKACHTIGGGKLVGPDLKGVTQRRSRDWLRQWILAPDKMLAQKDPIATKLLKQYNNVQMPNLGLSEAEVDTILAFLEHEAGGPEAEAEHKAGQAPAPAPAAAALPPGDPVIGKALFTGSMRFQNGGPPCMACHSIAGIGALGGGALGPDLTPAFNKYNGAAGLAAFLSGVPTPTMNAIWSQNPLTPQERANVIAFLKEASVSQRAPQALGRLAILAVIGLIVLLVLAQLIWRRRLTEVRRPMLGRTV